MRTLLSSAVIVGILVAYTASVGLTQSGPSIQGVWLATTLATNGKITNPKRRPGLLIHTKGYYSVVVQDARNATDSSPRRPLPPFKTPGKPTDAEKLAAYDLWEPLVVQSGTYEVKGNMLLRHPMVDKGATATPNGATFEIRFEDGGNTLVTSAPNGSVARYRRLE